MSVSSSDLTDTAAGVSTSVGWAERLWATLTSLKVAGSLGLAVLILAGWEWLPGALRSPSRLPATPMNVSDLS